MEREEQPERDVEELEERGDQVEQDIEEAKEQAAGTEGVDVESDDEPGDD